jgi:hypothetical protein
MDRKGLTAHANNLPSNEDLPLLQGMDFDFQWRSLAAA